VDREAEDLILDALQDKFTKLPGATAYTVFSEELGITTFPEGVSEREAHLVVFIDPIDGTEFIESFQGGWSLIAVYERWADEVIAGDIFLDHVLTTKVDRYQPLPGQTALLDALHEGFVHFLHFFLWLSCLIARPPSTPFHWPHSEPPCPPKFFPRPGF
jgi:hypothetical protein